MVTGYTPRPAKPGGSGITVGPAKSGYVVGPAKSGIAISPKPAPANDNAHIANLHANISNTVQALSQLTKTQTMQKSLIAVQKSLEKAATSSDLGVRSAALISAQNKMNSVQATLINRNK